MRIKVGTTKEIFEALDKMTDTSQMIKNVTAATHKEVKNQAKKHFIKGTLHRNILMKTKGGAGIVWIADDDMLVSWRGKRINYATFVLFGTRPHLIKAKNRKALRFSYKNLDEFVYRKSVRHPGYKGDDFLHSAAKKVFENLDKLIKES